MLALTRFSFIFSLVVTKELLGFSKALSIKLQGRYVDAVRAYHDIKLVKDTLKSTRATVDQFHSQIYKVALDIPYIGKVSPGGNFRLFRQQVRVAKN